MPHEKLLIFIYFLKRLSIDHLLVLCEKLYLKSAFKGFVLFEFTFVFMFVRFSLKYAVSIKSATLALVCKFVCFNLSVKFSIVKLFNSGVVIYLI